MRIYRELGKKRIKEIKTKANLPAEHNWDQPEDFEKL